ncbi:hypothetical protein QQ045_026891 [Rhodiola kirilowii]
MFDRKFKRKDGTYFTAGAEQKKKYVQKELEDAEAVVLSKHKDEERVREKELVEASATVMGVNPRSGISYLYGPAAILVSDKFSSTGTQSSATSQRSRAAPAEELLSQVQEMRPRLERIDEVCSFQSRQETEIRNMKECMERMM